MKLRIIPLPWLRFFQTNGMWTINWRRLIDVARERGLKSGRRKRVKKVSRRNTRRERIRRRIIFFFFFPFFFFFFDRTLVEFPSRNIFIGGKTFAGDLPFIFPLFLPRIKVLVRFCETCSFLVIRHLERGLNLFEEKNCLALGEDR